MERQTMIAGYYRAAVLVALVLLLAGCGGNSPKTLPQSCVVQASPQEFAYQLTSSGDGTTVSMFALNTCTGTISSTTPPTAPSGLMPGQMPAEDMIVDPMGRFAYIANLVSNATDQANIAMFTINRSTGVLT